MENMSENCDSKLEEKKKKEEIVKESRCWSDLEADNWLETDYSKKVYNWDEWLVIRWSVAEYPCHSTRCN